MRNSLEMTIFIQYLGGICCINIAAISVIKQSSLRVFFIIAYHLEKAREFDPFGHAGLTPLGIIRLTPSGKIKMTPVDDTAGEFFCSFENPCPGTAGFNVKYYKI